MTTVRLKYVLQGNDGGVWGQEPTGAGDSIVLRSTEQTSDGDWSIVEPAVRSLSTSERLRYCLVAGDVLVTKSSGSTAHVGKATLVDAEIESLQACYSNFMQRLRPSSKLDPRFLRYFLGSKVARAQLDIATTTTTGLNNLTGGILGNLTMPLVPLDEQRAIADYLDRETAQIDAFIAKNEELIELLAEARIGFTEDSFGRLVGKGRRLRGAFREIDTRAGKRSTILPLLSVSISSGVSRKELNSMDHESLELGHYKVAEKGDIVLNRMRAFQGAVGVAHETGLVSPDYAVLRCTDLIVPEWFELVMRTPRFLGEIVQRLRGIGDVESGAVRTPRVSVADLGEIRVDIPNYELQNSEIVMIHHRFVKTGRSIEAAKNVIVLAQERRAVLISAAVTGKIDVRSKA